MSKENLVGVEGATMVAAGATVKGNFADSAELRVANMDRPVMNGVPYIPKIIIEKLNESAIMPTYASEGDSGMDVYATEDMILNIGDTKLAKLGFKMDIPKHPFHELGYRWEAQARPRSGISLNTSIRVANAPGTIDNFYRGELAIILHNAGLPQYGINDNCELCVAMSDYAINLKGNLVLNDVPNEDGDCNLACGTYVIKKGDKIAQLVFNEVIRPMTIVEGVVGSTDRGAGGFGSTGV